jgi:ABC-type phosphate transport system auxiliary subunit
LKYIDNSNLPKIRLVVRREKRNMLFGKAFDASKAANELDGEVLTDIHESNSAFDMCKIIQPLMNQCANISVLEAYLVCCA